MHLIEGVLPELVNMGQQPRYILVENVAGFEVLQTTLSGSYFILNEQISGLKHERAAGRSGI